jgi:radical SAM/Cys-rich protein
MPALTLARQHHPLSDPSRQLELIDRGKPFEEALADSGRSPLRTSGIEVLQVNVGKVCNQTCAHCHVDAGPDRRESMSAETAELCLDVLARHDIRTLDITGGAPELNPSFRRLVERGRELGRQVIDRCNLTILLAAGYLDLPEFLAAHRVEVVASMPCYLMENVDRQRGAGVFDRSIEALKRLNAVGYGRDLPLTLVYNPVGPSLPPAQPTLEAAYREQLRGRFGIEFTRLFTITNMPISRFLDDLVRAGKLDPYMEKLIAAYNPIAADGVMCRTTLSVGWDGRLYDCDFNQMLDLGVNASSPRHIRDFDRDRLVGRRIVTGQHCYGCTAGAGSSCGGSLVS